MNQRTRFGSDVDELLAGSKLQQGGEIPVAGVGAGMAMALVEPFKEAVTAKSVEVRRDNAKVMVALKARAQAAGRKWVYSWEAKDRRSGGKSTIEGGTIKMANAIAQEYGNCSVETRVVDEGNYWNFYSRFVDWQTGFSLVRAFRQRKGQETGMGDKERQLDIVFQIGQSKSQRNVILNSLPDIADFCLEEAKNSLLTEIGKDPAKARAWIVKEAEKLGVELARIERKVGRTKDHWTNPDMAKIVSELEAIADNMIGKDDVYPEQDEGGAAAADEKKPESPPVDKAADPLADAVRGGAKGDVVSEPTEQPPAASASPEQSAKPAGEPAPAKAPAKKSRGGPAPVFG